MVRRRHRTFTCDETKPGCLACRRIGVSCTGYDANFVWVEDDGRINPSQGRRILPCASTWKGVEVLPSDVVDLLISQYDEDIGVGQQTTQPYSVSSLKSVSHNPFLVFAGIPPRSRQNPEGASASQLSKSIPQAMDSFPDSTWDEVFLFHHYVTHVAIIMMPYEHSRNPWKSQYPVAALELASSGQKSLYSAMLAHAAFNVAHLRGIDKEMVRLGSKHYGEAIQEMLQTISGEELDFPATMVSMMALMFAEIYSGPSGSWRHHFEGAWAWLKKHYDSEPWKSTGLIFSSLQSLNIIKIIGDTSKGGLVLEQSEVHHQHNVTDSTAVAPMLSTSDFGFTIGAPRNVLQCIALITDFRNKAQSDSEGEVDALLQTLLSRLEIHSNQDDSRRVFDAELVPESTPDEPPGNEQSPPEASDQIEAFVNATYIYMYRSLLNVPPKTVRPYVKRTFSHVSAYFAISNGNFSIWPAFIAAVEAYSEEDLVAAREWLDCATSFGIGSRNSMRLVVEEVWSRREAICKASGMELGLISVDWRSVMQEVNCDLLLV
ncbi:fungal-specific transcription factor domain-containing protein [Ilyonectria robusta]|uniref:fungal-specific transcription factor domain-containing protein n=1 Tax=Ilyonectria robusta TaxID=1079257 RepID=UPI001E8D3197|nr:fungal-specific transcription factor domain-containing protein [Ilyonectria robusta]KAH8734522.1 fungal-specific transcription factor domain-containing protein [Ilyonectria robusta]